MIKLRGSARDARALVRVLRLELRSAPVGHDTGKLKRNIQVLEEAIRLLGEYGARVAHPKTGCVSEGTGVDFVIRALTAAQKPLHIKKILRLIERSFGVTLKERVLTSRICKLVNERRTFVRVSPNTFGLVDWFMRSSHGITKQVLIDVLGHDPVDHGYPDDFVEDDTELDRLSRERESEVSIAKVPPIDRRAAGKAAIKQAIEDVRRSVKAHEIKENRNVETKTPPG